MEVVQGAIPHDLSGTFFRNGPGKFHIGDTPVAHTCDGDGLLASVAIRDGRAHFRARLIGTPEVIAERAAGRPLFRCTFATQRPGRLANALDLYLKNVSNTSVHCVGGRLWACFEGNQTTTVDPVTLAWRGLDTLGGVVPTGMPFTLGSPLADRAATALLRLAGSGRGAPEAVTRIGGMAMSAHPHWDAARERWCTFGYQMVPATGMLMDTLLTFFELDADGNVLAREEHLVPRYAFLHDFAFTENYYVLWLNPVKVDYFDYLSGKRCAASAVSGDERLPGSIVLIPRPDCDAAVRARGPLTIDAPATFVMHHCNAYEDPSTGRVLLDSVHYPAFPNIGSTTAVSNTDANASFQARLRRTSIDLDRRTCSMSAITPHYFEMPSVRETLFGRPHRFVYGMHSAFDVPATVVAKYDMTTGEFSTYSFGESTFVGEPVFVERPGPGPEDCGYLVCQVLDTASHAGYVAVLDAADIEAGPVATLRMRHPMPSSIHCTFTPEYFGP